MLAEGAPAHGLPKSIVGLSKTRMIPTIRVDAALMHRMRIPSGRTAARLPMIMNRRQSLRPPDDSSLLHGPEEPHLQFRRAGEEGDDGDLRARVTDSGDFGDEPTNPGIPLETIKRRRAERLAAEADRLLSATPRTMQDHLAADDGRPRPIRDSVDLTPELLKRAGAIPEGSHISASDPHSKEAALQNYELMRLADPNREVMLVHDPRTRKYLVVQGDAGSAKKPDRVWQLEQHSHPHLISSDLAEQLRVSLPSGSEGDVRVLRSEVDQLAEASPGTVVSRRSTIDVQINGERYDTHFSVTRAGDQYEVTIEFRHPTTGEATKLSYPSIAAYDLVVQDLSHGRVPVLGDGIRARSIDQPGVARARATHGEQAAPGRREGLDFVSQQMGQAGDFEAQLQGLRERGDIDPHLGRTAAIADAHERVRQMGLVGEPDSMIRLHNILNDPDIPVATRALISDVALEATRQQMIRSGQLDPSEPLVMLFHGATQGRARSLIEGGIDMTRNPGGNMDDFGEGLYFTQHLESALVYHQTGRGASSNEAAGAVIPYILRGRDFGQSVDVGTGGPHRAQWEAFVTENHHLFYGMRIDPDFLRTPHGMKALMEGQVPFGQFDAEGRGAVFNAFLEHLGGEHARPDIIFGDLGGPLTSGVQFAGGVTDQTSVRSQRIAEILNAQHILQSSNDGDGLTARTMGTAHGDEPAAARRRPELDAGDNGEEMLPKAVSPVEPSMGELEAHEQLPLFGDEIETSRAASSTGRRQVEVEGPVQLGLFGDDTPASNLAADDARRQTSDIAGSDTGQLEFDFSGQLSFDFGENAPLTRRERMIRQVDVISGSGMNETQQAAALVDVAAARFSEMSPEGAAQLANLLSIDREAVIAMTTLADTRSAQASALEDFRQRLVDAGQPPTDVEAGVNALLDFVRVHGKDFRGDLQLVRSLRQTVAHFRSFEPALQQMVENSSVTRRVAELDPAQLQHLHAEFAKTANGDVNSPLEDFQKVDAFEAFILTAMAGHPMIDDLRNAHRRIAFAAADATGFNAAADDARPHQQYEHDGYAFETDHLGRPVLAGTDDIQLSTGHSRLRAALQTAIGHLGRALGFSKDVGFHLMGHQFGGLINPLNVVPGNGYRINSTTPSVNLSTFKRVENQVKRLVRDPARRPVQFYVECVYNPGNNSIRPDSFIVRYRSAGGVWHEQDIPNV